MALQLNLEKSAATLRLSLEKAGIVKMPECEVGFALDVSGSFQREHERGETEIVLARMIPWAMVFDPDKKLDVFTFSRGAGEAHYVGELTADTHSGYVRKNIIPSHNSKGVPGYGGGTVYAPVLNMCREHFGWVQPKATASKGGWFGGMLGGSKPAESTPVAQRKTFILFITDGENEDRADTMRVLQEMQDKGEQIYIQLFGINSDSRVRFDFLQEAADKFDNTGLYICRDINLFGRMTDDELNALIIQEELLTWLQK